MRAGKKTGDIWLVIGVLTVAAVLFLLLWCLPQPGESVYITVDGEPFATLPLAVSTTVDVPGVGGGHCTLVIAGGQATVAEATCPDGICVRHRAVSRTGETIVCLPNRVAVTVVGGVPTVDGEV